MCCLEWMFTEVEVIVFVFTEKEKLNSFSTRKNIKTFGLVITSVFMHQSFRFIHNLSGVELVRSGGLFNKMGFI